MAALVALLMKSRRTALDMAVYQRRISSVKRMFEPENSLMNFMLPFSLANLAQDRKTRSRGEIRNKKWWEDGLQNWQNYRNQSLSYGNFVKNRLRFPSRKKFRDG